MKYQDLCIKLSEVLRAKGINTIYFEDVNLLNSEDVIYPAAVVQLVRVEQESHSDRYTIMLTIADGVRTGERTTEHDGWQKINVGIVATYGYIQHTGLLIYFNREQSTCGISDILPKCRLKVQMTNMPNEISLIETGYKELRPNYFDEFFSASAVSRQITYFGESSLYRRIQSYTPGGNVRDVEVFVPATDDVERSPFIYNIRGITEILANDERIQINSCVTTPFRWKFRDEVEGITAEINLSLFFDSNCN